MPRRKKKKEPEPITVQCPIKGHKHKLTLVDHPVRPDLLIAYCGNREVYQTANPEIHKKSVDDSPPPTTTSYRVRSYATDDKRGKGE